MFEGWVYQLVAGYLGNYIKDIHREQFRIGLWSGVALVENAELRLEAFDYLQLPFAIKQGFVGKLRLQIPWKTLFWEPIVVALEDVYICACPRDESEFDVEASENRALAAKKAKLAAAEITKLSSRVPDEKVRESLWSHLVAKFIANIQLTVRNIHIRYVDDKEESERNFDFGAKLAGLTINTSEARAGGAKQKGNLVHKNVEVDQFALYWNSASVNRKETKTSAGCSFRSWFSKQEESLDYILNPIDASAKLTINRAAASEGAGAQYALTVNAEKLDLNLGDCQLYECFLLLESLKVSQLRERYGRFRPHTGVEKPPGWQRLWWQYSINAVSSDVRKRLRRTSWRYFGWRLETRHRYVTLYKVKLESLQEGNPPNGDIVEALEELEKELDMEMILSFRALAEEKCQLKEGELSDSHKKSSDEQNATSSRGWLSLFSFGMLGSSGTMDAAAEVTGPFSDEIMKDLYKATNFHPNNHHQVNEWSNEYSVMTLSFQLQEATARMEKSETKQGLVEFTLEGLCAGFRRLQGSASAAFAIKTIVVLDLCTEGSCFPQIVLRKGMKNCVPSKNKTYAEALYGVGLSQRDLNEASISADIELSETQRWKFAITVKPLEFVYSPSVLLGLMDFFKLPDLREIDEKTESLVSLSENKTSFILTVDVKHPVLIIPECNNTKNSAVLVISLERLALVEAYGPQVLPVENQEKKLKLLNSTPVKHFDVKLTGMQVAIGKGAVDSAVTTPFWSNIMESFDVQTEVFMFNDSSGTFWKVQGDSGIISVAVSAESFKLLAAVLHSVLDELQVSPESSRKSTPSRVSALHAVRKLKLQVFMNDTPGVSLTGISCEFDQLELTVSKERALQQWAFSMQSFYVDNMDYPRSDQHKSLIKAESPLTFTCLKALRDEAPSLQLMLHVQNAQFGVYPKIIGALAAFIAGISTGSSSSAWGDSSPSIFSLEARLNGVSFVFHTIFASVATISLPSSSFLLSSCGSSSEWELEGSIDDLRLSGPEFSTGGITGVPFGSLDNASSRSKLRLRTSGPVLKIVVALERAKCILLGDYLAVLIGLIKSSDWNSPGGAGDELEAREAQATIVQYSVQVEDSLLVVPAGGGSFVEVVIPEFKFSFVPPELKMELEESFFAARESLVGENLKFFVITGKNLSLASYSKKCCYPLINCLDGDIVVTVPVVKESELQTTIFLEFSLVDLIFAGKEFLDQIDIVELLSTDLARVGKKSSFASSIWECLEAGNAFVPQMPTEANQEPGAGLSLRCSTEELRTSIFNQKKDGSWEKVLLAKGTSIAISSSLDGEGALTSLDINLKSIALLDGGGEGRAEFQNPEPEVKTLQLRTLLSVHPGESSEINLRSTLAPSLQREIHMLLPSVNIWMHLASWSKVISWVFICFPMVPELDEKKVTVATPSTCETRVLLEVPGLLVALPGSGGEQAIYFTTRLLVKEVENLGTSLRFQAELSEMKAETFEASGPRLSCFSGGSVQIRGEVELELSVMIALLFTVDFIDCWCSYSVLQFLNSFRLEPAPEDEEDGLGLELAVRVQAEVGDVSLLVTDGRWNYNCPLLELVLGNSYFELSWSDDSLQFNISSLLETSYHNIQKVVWEPFLEPWRVSASVVKAASTTSVEVSSSSCLNINLTEGFSQAVKRAVEMICWSQEKESNDRIRSSFSHYAPYWLQNDTGTTLYYSLVWPSFDDDSTGDHPASGDYRWSSLMPGLSVPLFVDVENEGRLQRRKPRWNTLHGASERKKFGLMSHRRIRVQLEGTAAASRPMSIDLVGKRPFEVIFSKFDGGRDGEIELDHSTVFSTHVLFEVSLHHHSKLIRLCSTVALTNMTSLPLEVRLEIPFAIAPKIMEPVLPNEVAALPVHLAETGRMRLRPFGSEFLWSEAHSLSKLVSVENKQFSLRPVLCYPARPNNAPFRCCINAEQQLVSAPKTSEILLNGSSSGRWRTWNIILQAPFLVKNGLPCPVKLAIESSPAVNVQTSVSKGDSVFLYELDVVNDLSLTFTLPGFLPSSLKFSGGNARERGETDVVVFNRDNTQDGAVHARVDRVVDLTCGRREVCISVQYCLYNCTGLDLAFLDGDGEAYTGKEQVLFDTLSDVAGKVTASAAPPKDQGLHSLITTNPGSNSCLFWRTEPGKLSSHLPSCKVFKRLENSTPARDLSGNFEAVEAEPFLYSPAQSSEAGEHKMRLRIFQPSNSAWSQAFLLNPPGGASPILIPQWSTRGAYVLCVSSMPVTGACSEKTKTVTFRPRYVLANASRQDICFRQQGTDIVQHLPAGRNVNVHWTDMTKSLFISVRYDEQGWDWSGGFALDRLGDTQVKAHNHLTGKMEMLRVEVVYPDAEGHSIGSGNDRLGTLYIILTNDETGFMPYRIENFSLVRLRFYQRRCEKRENILQPYCACDYAWDEPCLPPQLVIEVPGEGSLGAYELDDVKTYPSISLHSSGQKTDRRFLVSVHAEGARRVLSVTDSSLHTPKDLKLVTFRLEDKLSQSAVEKFTLKLASIGVSLVDSTPQELMYASARGVTFQLSQNEREQEVKLELMMLQVDNQLRHPSYPVMLSRNLFTRNWSVLNTERVHPETETGVPTLSLLVSKWRNPAGSVDCFRCIYLSVAPLRLELEERGLARMFGFLRSFVAAGSEMEPDKTTAFKVRPLRAETGSSTSLRFVEVFAAGQHYRSSPVQAPTRKLINSAKQKRKIYVEDFCIESLELTISFSSDPWLPKESRGVAARSILWATGTLLQRRLIALADVEDAPVRLRELVLAHPMANWNAIVGILQRHYTRQLLHEVYKVLGSADVFGNPMSFVRSLGSGMWDFVSAPATSLRQNPVHIVQGVRLGTKSLFRNTVFAFSNAATQMSKAARKGVAVLALDQDYLNEHETHDESRDSSIVNEFLEGLTGLLQSSVVGAEKHGIPGVFSGMAVGMLRAIARPAASMLEVAGKTARSIRNSSRPAQPRVSRVRLPRHLEPGSPLLPYSWNEALGMAVLLEADNGRMKEEVYITCQPLAESGVFVLLSENFLYLVKEDCESEQWVILEKNRVEDILYINREGDSLDLLSSSEVLRQRGTSPFKNVSLKLGSSEGADELQSKLLELMSKERNKLSAVSIVRNL